MRERRRHPSDPGMTPQYQFIDDGAGCQPGELANEVDFAHPQNCNDGSRSRWAEDMPPPFHRHPQPGTQQRVRDTPQLVREPLRLVADGPFHTRPNNPAAVYSQFPYHLPEGPAFGTEVNSGGGGRGPAAKPTLQPGFLPGSRQFGNAIFGHDAPKPQGPKLPPFRIYFHHKDGQLPGELVRRLFDVAQAESATGIHQIFDLPIVHSESASRQNRNHQGMSFPTVEQWIAGENSRPTRKRWRESFEAQDPPDEPDSVCQLATGIIDHVPTRMRANGMFHPAPKRRRRFPSGLFEITPDAEVVSPTRRTPEGKPGQRGSQPAQKPASQLVRVSRNIEAIAQARLIAKLASGPSSSITQTAHEVFSEEQCEIILWLALHGVSSSVIARLLSANIRKPSNFRNSSFVPDVNRLVQHFIAELATGQERTKRADEMVEHLLQQGDRLGWSPYLLRRAVGLTTSPGDEAARIQEVRENAVERQALLKWRNNHMGENPVESTSGRRAREQVLAFRGLMREAMEEEMLERLGYRKGTHEVEKVLMKKWLLKIRELGKLPDRLVEGEDGAHSIGLDETGTYS
ncbi:uncharacterized protein Z519_03269 [Cladophialophora bantiana CBS 173.52]|uniref:Uncharacterized protein n=1 Tax=Cladophialophora bantiana (strain ATCC 10958 / CBS 173.52 / CDC B-1940 / NIH 8579) TaxID=1442370 RepID=A0A0D2F1W8_CLAB1|nr:uncharacterized protein Z519_03269 [Cladophialophora bantiana CBS 173.52]KIW96201.1 hypothetical protein Z519_03269 [Cladophialophora bantiana CBS 173.52]